MMQLVQNTRIAEEGSGSDFEGIGGSYTSSEEEEAGAGDRPAWHYIEAIPMVDPVTGKEVMMLIQMDVSVRAEMEERMTALTEAQLTMLEQMFPRHVLEYMIGDTMSVGDPDAAPGVHAPPRSLAASHSGVTILFMDIVGFTTMSKEVEPAQVMLFLNSLFTLFDELIDQYDVYKVETAGDCYIVAGALMCQDKEGFLSLEQNPDAKDGAEKVMTFAKAMLRCARTVKMPHNGETTRVRVGMHTGDVVTGLIGTKLPKFSIFGDTMNTASRMESTCPVGCIQVSEVTHELLSSHTFNPTGGVEVKGKGLMETYLWVPEAHPEEEYQSITEQAQEQQQQRQQSGDDSFDLFGDMMQLVQNTRIAEEGSGSDFEGIGGSYTSSEEEEAGAGDRPAWHYIEAIPMVDPVTGKEVMMLIQMDVSVRAEMEERMTALTEAQLTMLEQMFPRHVLEYMIGDTMSVGDPDAAPGVHAPPRSLAASHSGVTILFMDIVGFTTMSKEVEPAQVMLFLNSLFTLFDELIDQYDVYKVSALIKHISNFRAPSEPEATSSGSHAGPPDQMFRVSVRQSNGGGSDEEAGDFYLRVAALADKANDKRDLLIVAAVQRDKERWIGQQVAEAQDMLRKKNLRQLARACDRLAGRSRSHQIPPAMRDGSGALHSGPDGVLKAMTESFDKLYGGETKLSDETLNQLENDVAAFELTRATEVAENAAGGQSSAGILSPFHALDVMGEGALGALTSDGSHRDSGRHVTATSGLGLLKPSRSAGSYSRSYSRRESSATAGSAGQLGCDSRGRDAGEDDPQQTRVSPASAASAPRLRKSASIFGDSFLLGPEHLNAALRSLAAATHGASGSGGAPGSERERALLHQVHLQLEKSERRSSAARSALAQGMRPQAGRALGTRSRIRHSVSGYSYSPLQLGSASAFFIAPPHARAPSTAPAEPNLATEAPRSSRNVERPMMAGSRSRRTSCPTGIVVDHTGSPAQPAAGGDATHSYVAWLGAHGSGGARASGGGGGGGAHGMERNGSAGWGPATGSGGGGGAGAGVAGVAGVDASRRASGEHRRSGAAAGGARSSAESVTVACLESARAAVAASHRHPVSLSRLSRDPAPHSTEAVQHAPAARAGAVAPRTMRRQSAGFADDVLATMLAAQLLHPWSSGSLERPSRSNILLEVWGNAAAVEERGAARGTAAVSFAKAEVWTSPMGSGLSALAHGAMYGKGEGGARGGALGMAAEISGTREMSAREAMQAQMDAMRQQHAKGERAGKAATGDGRPSASHHHGTIRSRRTVSTFDDRPGGTADCEPRAPSALASLSSMRRASPALSHVHDRCRRPAGPGSQVSETQAGGANVLVQTLGTLLRK
ncbi:hypothetical protein FOA52_004270 [Chlamydomonas sp. UWO 241]|nr:hypothetical protein FOA52_004270 [Chlamydomonas sp. UWO 241]